MRSARQISSIIITSSFMKSLCYATGMSHTDFSVPLCTPITVLRSRYSNNMVVNVLYSFLFLLSVDSRLRMIYLWLICTVFLLRRSVILVLPYSVHFSVIHTPVAPWHPYHVAGSFILWPPPHPLLGDSSVSSSVSIASLRIATSRFGIIFRRNLGVPPVVYISSRSSSGVVVNLVSP